MRQIELGFFYDVPMRYLDDYLQRMEKRVEALRTIAPEAKEIPFLEGKLEQFTKRINPTLQ